VLLSTTPRSICSPYTLCRVLCRVPTPVSCFLTSPVPELPTHLINWCRWCWMGSQIFTTPKVYWTHVPRGARGQFWLFAFGVRFLAFQGTACTYPYPSRGTSLIRKRTPLGPYSRHTLGPTVVLRRCGRAGVPHSYGALGAVRVLNFE